LDSAFTASAESNSHTARGRRRAPPGGALASAGGKRGRVSTPAARLGLAIVGGERKGQGGLGRALGRCQRSARRAGPSATGEKGGWAGLKSRELSPLFLFIPKAI